MNQLSLLSMRMQSERLAVLKDNEKHVANGGKDAFYSDQEVDLGMDDDEHDLNSDDEWER